MRTERKSKIVLLIALYHTVGDLLLVILVVGINLKVVISSSSVNEAKITVGGRHRWRYTAPMVAVAIMCFMLESIVDRAPDLLFLRELTRDVIEASRVQPGSNGGGTWPIKNSCGFTLITPGKDTYPAFWVRDFSMAVDSGFVTQAEMQNHLNLIAKCQTGPEGRLLKNSQRLPAWSIPDHINYDGTAVFYPGTFASGDDQGSGAFGQHPPIDDHFEFIHIAYALYCSSKNAGFLDQDAYGLKMIDRLANAFYSPSYDPVTQLAESDEKARAVGFGFCDAEAHTGKLLFASLLRYRAAGELAEMCSKAGDLKRTKELRQIQREIRKALPIVFSEASMKGWLKASTGQSGQADVWGTIYALYLGILDGSVKKQAEKAVKIGVREGTIVYEGAVRHVPTDMDFSPTTAWERSYAGLNTYQNGAYWHTPTGWLIKVLDRIDKPSAQLIFLDFIKHLRDQDFRKGGGAPWECFGKDGKARQNPIYMASVALPYSVIKDTKR